MSAGDARRRLEQALADHGCSVRGKSAQCPGPGHSNGDQHPSLSIGDRKDGRGVLVSCKGGNGCQTDAILEALGMSGADLFDEPLDKRDRGEWTPFGDAVAVYDYTDESGILLYQVCRTADKQFPQRRPDKTAKSGWRWNLGGTRRVLYRLPRVVEAAKNGETVWFCEGEKDVASLERAGVVATTSGSAGSWRAEYADVLAGADVVIVADRDKDGYPHAAAVAASLGGKAKSVQVVEAASGKDASDHLTAGYGLGDFAPADLSASLVEPAAAAAGSTTEAGPVADRLGQLRAALVDSAALDSIKPPLPVIDGLLYRDGLAWLYGKPATYKSFIALDWAGCVSTGLPWQEHETTQGPVLYLIAEGTAGLRKRVRAWEDYADCTMLATFLPVAVQLLNPADLTAFTALVAELDPVLVVIDTQARVTVGADENSTMEMGRLVAAADKIRAVCQACVLIVHHEPRGGENMRGSIALEGAATSLFRAERDGTRITVKNVRQRDVIEADDVVLHAAPRLESVVLGSNEGHWSPALPSASEKQILQVLSDVFLESGASASTLIKTTKLAESTFHYAMKNLISRGEVVNNGSRNRSCYQLAPKGSLQLAPMGSNSNSTPDSNSNPPYKGVGVTGVLQIDKAAS